MHRKFFKRKFFILSVLVCICMTIMQSAGAENLKAEELKDGTYTVNIALWHQFMDKPSMGNKGIIPEAELEVKDGKATMFIETQIIQVTGITASVVSFFNFNEEKQDFTKAEAHAYNFEIDGQKRPKIFLFPIKPGSEYYRCMVDPKVEVMGDKPIEARLKVDWSSLKLVEKSLKQEIIDENAESDILAKLELQKQEQEALANSDGTVKEKHEILPVVPVESGASMSEIGTGIIGRPGPSLSAMPVIDPDGGVAGEVGDIDPVDFSRTTESADDESSVAASSAKKAAAEERRGIILGILLFIVALIAASIAVIIVFLRKIIKEKNRAAYLDIFEGELEI